MTGAFAILGVGLHCYIRGFDSTESLVKTGLSSGSLPGSFLLLLCAPFPEIGNKLPALHIYLFVAGLVLAGSAISSLKSGLFSSSLDDGKSQESSSKRNRSKQGLSKFAAKVGERKKPKR